MIDKKIRHYKILEKLGEGGMGIVYLAEDTKLDRRVAIKFLPRHFAANSEERKRFEVEAKAAAALNHPNIATIYAIEQSPDEVFIVMEYIEGQTIQEKLTASGPLPAAECTDIATQIAAGLQAAHDKGITHRDIKSANIMVTIRGDVKIMDFGLAKFGGSIQLTQTGSTVGTVAYMSPEQARGDEVDHRSDIWAFGVVLYELLTGTLPFPGDYEQAVIYSILNEPPKLKKAAFTAVDPKIRDLVFKALEKEVSDRFQSMEEMLQILAAHKTQSSSKIAAVKDKKGIRRSPALLLAVATVIIVFAILGWNYYQQTRKEAWARNDILPKIDSLISLTPWTGEGNSTWEAYKLNNQIKDIMLADPYYQSVVSKFLVKNSFRTVPAQSKVFIQAYADTSENWVYLGESPIDSIPFPRGISKVRFEKAGYASGFDVIWNASFIEDTINFTLLPDNQIPSGMVFVPKDASRFNIKAAPANLHLPGLEMTQFVDCGDFYMDRFEVSNREFKEFVDAGGYSEPKYWKYPFVQDGKEISWQESMAILVDQTGQPGPASWVVGDYPAGSADLPVNGVSWYEAVAYAEFRGKSLPTIFHWDRVAFTWASPNIVPLSNIAGTELKVVNDRQGENRFGVYNLAGNVREWCYNESWRGRFILGGGWSDPVYAFNDAYAQKPFDRSEINGFRCIKYTHQDDVETLTAYIDLPRRDFLKETPVDDETFKFFLKQFTYDRGELGAEIISSETREEWVKYIVRINAAYGNERMNISVFLPPNAKPPYQTVVYFPGSGAIHTRSSKDLDLESRVKFIVKSGRALIYPVYKSTYERGDNLVSDYPEATSLWKDHIIMWTKDFSRTIDYLETRDDIDIDRLVYYGASWGGAMGGIIPAVEKRLRGSILLVAGLQFQKTFPEVEAVNYLPRITIPILMLNGKYDFFFPYETAQVPFYKLLGTPAKDKKMFVYEGGHTVPYTEMVKEVLNWLDENLGKVIHN